MGTIDAAVRSTVVRATTINTLWGEAQLESSATFRCERCHRRQFFHEGRTKCVACGAHIPQAKIFRPPPLRLPFGHWVCKRLKSVRLQRGLSQRALASMVPCPRTYLSKYENLTCVPTLGIIDKLARALGIELAELLDRNVSVNRLVTCAVLDAAGQASHGALMAEVMEMLPQLCAGARETLLLAARGMANGQGTFEDWIKVN